MSFEALKRRINSRSLPPCKDYPVSAWERMIPEEKRADVRKWIKVWTDHYPEDKLTEPETEALVTRLVDQTDGDRRPENEKAATRIAVALMTDAEIERRVRGILVENRGLGSQ
jgi:hypothetical protein